MAEDSDSSLSSAASEKDIQRLAPIFLKAKRATKTAYPPPAASPPRPKRAPSPPHDEVLADNPDIAFIVMFRSRFSEVFSSKLAHFGPQDIERGVADTLPTPQAENLLCALLALVLNRKKPVERGHHSRALEEAVLSQKSQWPHHWAGINPLHGSRDFRTMSPTQRVSGFWHQYGLSALLTLRQLNLLRTLIMWSLTSSEAISTMIKERYKQQRQGDDENQPLSVQPWGTDGDKRRYFLIQGLDDTSFRVYREGSRYTRNAHWYSVAGDIEEAKMLAAKLEGEDGTQAARRLALKITNAVPMFEATEEKRRRREYRQIRRAAFTRPEPGFSLYEGRTRGKRARYTFEDDDDFDSDATSTRRSTRHSERETPIESGPEYTASGRQVKKPRTGGYGESLLSNAMSVDELAPEYDDVRARSDESEPVRPSGRATRNAANGRAGGQHRKHIEGHNNIDAMSAEEESADEWNSGKEDDVDDDMPTDGDANEDEDLEDSEDEPVDEEEGEPQSLLLKLKVSPKPATKVEEDEEGANEARPVPHDPVTAEPDPAFTGSLGSAGQVLATPPAASSAYPTPASISFAAELKTQAVESAKATSTAESSRP
nr:hypothetical protein CFP56_34945 [Quercus suber]